MILNEFSGNRDVGAMTWVLTEAIMAALCHAIGQAYASGCSDQASLSGNEAINVEER